MSTEIVKTEKTLDPQDWENTRKLGHKMVDDMVDFLQNIHHQPVWKPIPEAIKETYQAEVPLEGKPLDQVYSEFLDNILPYFKGNIHPSFWAWVQGTGSITAAFADMLASAMNSNVTIGEHAAMYIDHQVVNWCKQMMDFPAEASGLLTSGGSMANFTALTVARNTFTGHHVRHKGLKALEKQLIVYCSVETHSCVIKGIEVLGIGRDHIRMIGTDDQYRIDLTLLEYAIAEDQRAGFLPFCIVANAGTVNTGAIDNLAVIRTICDRYRMWMHVDGAFGSLAYLVPGFKNELSFLKKADSLVFDLHKWMYMPYEVGCVLFQSAADHRSTFAIEPNYLLKHERGLAAGPDSLNNYGLELSRGFKALKVWMTIKEFGLQHFTDLIRQNIDQIFYLRALVEKNPNLELCAPVVINVLCFRFVVEDVSQEVLNEMNKEIIMTLQEKGIASPSSTLLNGKYCIRIAHVNHRSRRKHFDDLISAVVEIGSNYAANRIPQQQIM